MNARCEVDDSVCLTHKRAIILCVRELEAEVKKWDDDAQEWAEAMSREKARAEEAEKERDRLREQVSRAMGLYNESQARVAELERRWEREDQYHGNTKCGRVLNPYAAYDDEARKRQEEED